MGYSEMPSQWETGTRWLTNNQYRRIRYRAQKMGAKDICLNSIFHSVKFGHVSVSFAFYPLEYHCNISPVSIWAGHFSDRAGADAIKVDMDKALEFIEYLKEFNSDIQNQNRSK